MNKVLILMLAAVCFVGCAPTHTLKEVVNNPALIFPGDGSGDNALTSADQWVRKNLW